MAIIEQDAGPATDAPQDVAHGIAPHLVEAKIGHARANSVTNRANLTVKAGNSDELTQELNHGAMMFCQFLLHSNLCITYVHKNPPSESEGDRKGPHPISPLPAPTMTTVKVSAREPGITRARAHEYA